MLLAAVEGSEDGLLHITAEQGKDFIEQLYRAAGIPLPQKADRITVRRCGSACVPEVHFGSSCSSAQAGFASPPTSQQVPIQGNLNAAYKTATLMIQL